MLSFPPLSEGTDHWWRCCNYSTNSSNIQIVHTEELMKRAKLQRRPENFPFMTSLLAVYYRSYFSVICAVVCAISNYNSRKRSWKEPNGNDDIKLFPLWPLYSLFIIGLISQLFAQSVVQYPTITQGKAHEKSQMATTTWSFSLYNLFTPC